MTIHPYTRKPVIVQNKTPEPVLVRVFCFGFIWAINNLYKRRGTSLD
jgi:hypothetical protein